MKTGFALFCFVLRRDATGRPTQEIKRCGEFQSIEMAFSAAKTGAVRTWKETVAAMNPADRKANIRISDTEWGYEVKRDALVICRYWVHDAAPLTIASAST